MQQSFRIVGVIVCAFVVTLLFHNQFIGLNLLLFEVIVIPWVVFTSNISFNRTSVIVSVSAVSLTAVFTVITNTAFTLFMNFVSVLVLLGVLIYPEANFLITNFILSALSIITSPITFAKELLVLRMGKSRIVPKYLRLFIILLFPLVVVVAFISMYKSANPIFNTLVDSVTSSVTTVFDALFKNMDLSVVWTFIVGIVISAGILLRVRKEFVIDYDKGAKFYLERRTAKTKKNFSMVSLRYENTAALFLFITLTGIITVLNVLDIYWVWFNFEWKGQFLKTFVHEGTYVLILSIIISIALVLYYFRRNLNFYPNNTLLKRVVYIWLAQNALLSVSVGIRNYWYIYYFSLAYKRIGVFVFLVLAVFCMYTIWVKVREQKSIFYLVKMNGLSLFIVLVVSSLWNWDSIIASYNFNNPNKSFLHLEYMVTLSDCTLPELDKSLPELDTIEKQQYQKFQSLRYQPMSAKEYHEIIQKRKTEFKSRWENQYWLSWNYPDYKAYQQLYGNVTK
ncbi:MAG: DUF4153 domain-containing protein [Candidatus Kapaibacterium sp.]